MVLAIRVACRRRTVRLVAAHLEIDRDFHDDNSDPGIQEILDSLGLAQHQISSPPIEYAADVDQDFASWLHGVPWKARRRRRIVKIGAGGIPRTTQQSPAGESPTRARKHPMNRTNRRTLLRTAGAAMVAAGLRGQAQIASAADGPKSPWKRAFMLGGLSEGSPLPVFQLLKDAGFDGVELISPNKLALDEVQDARDKTGLVIHGVSGSRHWRDTLSDPDPDVVARGMEAIRQEFADCKAYGGTTVLVVPAVVNKKVNYREAYERSHQNIQKLIPDAEKYGIKIAIEEVWNKFLLSPVEFARYIDEFASPWVGAYFDVGNIVEYGYPEQWIRELGKRILKVHIKEYAKPNRFSYGLGEGEIDWNAVRAALIEIGYKGWITAEVGLGDLEAMKDVVRRMNKLLLLS